MATLADVVADRKTYPDTLTYEKDGLTFSLKDLREGFLPKAEMTKLTERAAAEKKHLEGQLSQVQEEYQRAITAVTALQARAKQGDAPPDELQAYLDDPAFAPLAKLAKGLQARIEELDRRTKDHETTWWAQQHLNTIQSLKDQDKELDPQELLQFAKGRNLTNLADAYRLKNYERDLARAAKDAEAKGYEKGKKEAALPVVPSVGRRPSSPPPEAPKSFEEAKQRALEDPEIHQLFSGEMGA